MLSGRMDCPDPAEFRDGLKTFELELDENGYVARCGITDTVPGSK